jgi:hypothetical protein
VREARFDSSARHPELPVGSRRTGHYVFEDGLFSDGFDSRESAE